MSELTPPERALRDRLQSAVPPLPTPPDRLASVRARVRRARAARAATAVLAVVSMIAAARLSTTQDPPAGPGAGPCAAVPASWSPHADLPGDLVPTGAVSVTRCGPPDVHRTLTAGVDAVVRAANARPAAPADRSCPPAGHAADVALVFGYPDGRTVVVLVDRGCDTVSTSERTRAGADLLDVFDVRWRLHVVTPGSVPS